MDAIRDQILRPSNIELLSTPITKEEFQRLTMTVKNFYRDCYQCAALTDSDNQDEWGSLNDSADEDSSTPEMQ